MGEQYVQFKCHHCNHCCTEVVCMPTPWDVNQIVRYTGQHPLTFLEWLEPDEVTGVEDNDPTWLEVDGTRYIMALKRDEKTGCHFLDRKTRYCSIYAARPLLCRLYPFRVQRTRDGEFRGFALHSDVGCPRHRDGKVEVEPLRAIFYEDEGHQQDYYTLVEVFNRTAYAGKRPEHFVDLFFEDKNGRRGAGWPGTAGTAARTRKARA